MHHRHRPAAFAFASLLAATACSSDAGPTATPDVEQPDAPDSSSPDVDGDLLEDTRVEPSHVAVTQLFPKSGAPGVTFPGCVYASPLGSPDGESVIVAASSGQVAALDPLDGSARWTVLMPTPEGEDPYILATPVIVGDRLVVVYHTTPTPSGKQPGEVGHNVNDKRLRHRVAVVDLAQGTLDAEYPPFDLAANLTEADGEGAVPFKPTHALARGSLVHGVAPGDELGRVYVTFGNARDIQPWHGWAFEVSLDAWRTGGGGAAQTAVLVTTPESDCGKEGTSGSRERICGGGIWSPSGPLLVSHEGGGFEIILPAGNGQLDLSRDDYANTLIRVGPGLEIDTGCDPVACAGFDPDEPATACIESCSDLYIPRLSPEDPPLFVHDGRCEGLTMFECWQKMDYVGGSTPVRVQLASGKAVFAYPTKDGHLYLVDADHMGTQYDREELVVVCGAPGDKCKWDWAGMIVTQPAVVEGGEHPVIIVPTFMPDETHPAGVVALAIVEDAGGPRFERLWEFPAFDSAEAVTRFRRHPSRLATALVPGSSALTMGWVVETAAPGGKGRLVGLRLSDGQALVDQPLEVPGIRFSLPLVAEDVVYFGSCGNDVGPGHIEGWRIDAE